MGQNWKIKKEVTKDLILQLLANRGLKTKKEIERFFHPQLSDYESSLKLKGISQAKKRIQQAITNKELIIIYGDYDVDGLCGTAILYHGLAALGAKVLPYIPHREKEGYGLSQTGLDQSKEKGASLIITVDNGIVALEQALYAQNLGLDLIITDHHSPMAKLPKALAIIHSTKLCGAAVGWCLVRKLVAEKKAQELLDLAALATICDLVPLLGVNRALVKIGLEEINQTKKVGLLALMTESGLQVGEVNAYHLGHILGPRLNALGRLEHSIDALRLLCTSDLAKARQIAVHISEANEQKKKLVGHALLEAKELMVSQNIKEQKILVIHSSSWNMGIIGLVAGRISEEYKIPTITISQGETISKGSARSSNGLNIIETLRKCSDLFIDLGGHPKAAGFTIETAKIPQLKVKLSEVVDCQVSELREDLEIEAVLPVKEISRKQVKDLAQLEPTGIANPKPVLASMNMRISDLRTVGSGEHLKFKADDLEAIAFAKGNLLPLLKAGQLVNLAYYLEEDNWNGQSRIQLKVVDLQII